MIYLLASILLSTLIFVIFKLFDRYKVDNLQAIVVNYLVAGLLGWMPLFENVTPVGEIKKWSFWPLLIGCLFISLFQLMAHITQKSGVAVVGVTVKMAMVIPVMAGAVLYNEDLGGTRWIGIALALVSVWMMNVSGKESGSVRINITWPIILFFGSGILDSLIKYIEHNIIQPDVTPAFTGTAFLCAGILGLGQVAYRTLIRKTGVIQWKNILWGMILGVPNFGCIYYLIRALEQPGWDSVQVFPVNNVGIVALSALLGAVVFSEKLGIRKITGLILALMAIALISLNHLF